MIRKIYWVLCVALMAVGLSARGDDTVVKHDYVVRKKTRVMAGVPSEPSPINVMNLSEAEAADLRARGYTVELNGKMSLLVGAGMGFGGLAYPRLVSGAPKTKPLWALDAVHSRQANAIQNGDGTGITICLVDTGVMQNHPALVGRISGGANFTSTGQPSDFSDTLGHGTLVAGIMAGNDVGNFRGVAPGADIYVAKVFDKAGGGDYATIARGLQSCAVHSQIVNLSLGSDTDSQVLSDVIEQLVVGQGMIVFAAAGNQTKVAFPARDPNVVAVGAVDANFNVATFSPRGTKIEFVAPGEGIFGPCLFGYGIFSGTSLSAGIVSAIEAIRQSRQSASLRTVDLGKPSTDQGAGLVDAELTAH